VTDEAILGHPRVDAVLVTWNRMKLLTECLTMLGALTRPPDVLVVVDNASTDGSHDVIRTQFPDVDPVTSTRNTGNDDFEYTARILRNRRAIYVPMALAVHRTAELGTKLVDPGVRFHHEVRNKNRVLRAGEALEPAQAVDDLEPHW
jgi:glycosyltransferase involved in cell wall biosynthesis